MKKQLLLLALVSLLSLGGCTSYKGVRIIYPEYQEVVADLQPTLTWEAAPGSNVTYELILYEGDQVNPSFYKKGLKENEHTIERELKPGTWYRWSVRSNSDGVLSAWTKKETHIFTGVSLHKRSKYMIFATPDL